MENSPEHAIFEKLKAIGSPKLTISPWVIFIVSILLCIGLYYFLSPQTNPFINLKLIIGLVSVIIVLGLTVTYFYAYLFFTNSLYIYISLGWVANASYLIFEFFFTDKCSANKTLCDQSHSNNQDLSLKYCNIDEQFCLKYSITVFVFSLISTCLFYYANSKNQKDFSKSSDSTSSNYLTKTKLQVIIFALVSIIYAVFIYYFLELIDYRYQFAIATIVGMSFTFFALSKTGNTLRGIVNSEEKYKELKIIRLLPWTFFFYAALQIFYPLKLVTSPEFQLSIFAGASLLKLLNISGMIAMLTRFNFPVFIQAQEDKTFAENELKITEKELEIANLKLKQSNQLATLGAISASIEHDLKTPLGVLKTEILSMKRKFSNNTNLLPHLTFLESQGRRISAIARVIPFIRASNEFYNTERFMSKISVTEIVNLAIRSVKRELLLNTEKFFFVNKNKEYYIRAYSEMIEQIFTNLFKNSLEAIKEKGKDGGVITIDIRQQTFLPDVVAAENPNAKDYNKWIVVSIKDEGCGIPKEKISELTTLYTSKGDDKPNGGIGLFIANLILEFHDSIFHFESKLGEGTTVSIYFPEWEAYLLLNENKEVESTNKGIAEKEIGIEKKDDVNDLVITNLN